ncbi:uncharacterized protein LOC123691306 isoform X2 [Colias croceus]|uniref:uncharacterized protein LOC123691306 isoform X2 n=1 Tax=Colias crocea TaxID=72248 RepID=UPI001E27BCC1|nr:uncharacterized protein LOC123691306 isoform X2 [Colias croceus]
MLYISIVTLLFTHNGISTEEIEERTAGVFSRMIPIMIPINLAHLEQPFQDGIPGDGGNIVLGAQTYQNGMTFNVDPNGPNIFGAYTNHVNQNFKFVGNQNQAQPNGGGIQYGSSTVQINNHYKTRKYARNSNEPRGYQSGHAQPEVNAETEKKSQNTAESQAYAAQPNSSSKHLSLSFNKFCVYFSVVLFKYCLF